ncbi:MAG: phosphatase PAP2 family protein [Pyrinomonadaceae bacterium]
MIAREYGHHRPLVQVGAYGLATAVSLSRYTGRNHFLSDVLVGSAMGYGIGRYVYHKHHATTLDAWNGKTEWRPGALEIISAHRSAILPTRPCLWWNAGVELLASGTD